MKAEWAQIIYRIYKKSQGIKCCFYFLCDLPHKVFHLLVWRITVPSGKYDQIYRSFRKNQVTATATNMVVMGYFQSSGEEHNLHC